MFRQNKGIVEGSSSIAKLPDYLLDQVSGGYWDMSPSEIRSQFASDRQRGDPNIRAYKEYRINDDTKFVVTGRMDVNSALDKNRKTDAEIRVGLTWDL